MSQKHISQIPKSDSDGTLSTERSSDRFAIGSVTPVTANKSATATPAVAQAGATRLTDLAVIEITNNDTSGNSLGIGWAANINTTGLFVTILKPGDMWTEYFNDESTLQPYICAAAGSTTCSYIVTEKAGA